VQCAAADEAAPWGLLLRNPRPWPWVGGRQRHRPRGGRAWSNYAMGAAMWLNQAVRWICG